MHLFVIFGIAIVPIFSHLDIASCIFQTLCPVPKLQIIIAPLILKYFPFPGDLLAGKREAYFSKLTQANCSHRICRIITRTKLRLQILQGEL